MVIASSVSWAVSEGASVAASDVHSSAVSESEARSREAASAWWHSKAGVRCDTISFPLPSESDVPVLRFRCTALGLRRRCSVLSRLFASFCFVEGICILDLVEFCILRLSRHCNGMRTVIGLRISPWGCLSLVLVSLSCVSSGTRRVLVPGYNVSGYGGTSSGGSAACEG